MKCIETSNENRQARTVCALDGQRPAAVSEDHVLILQIALQDPQALALLYQRFGNRLYSLAFKMLHSHHEAEEVLQDAFVRIWRQAAHYDQEKASPFAWAVMITRRLSIDRLRSRQRRTHLLEQREASAPPIDAETFNGQESLLAQELSCQMAAALDKLPYDQWESIDLVFYQGLTQMEVAQATQQPLGTIKSRIRRGMIKLRELLRDLYA